MQVDAVTMARSRCLAVPKKRAQEARAMLSALGLLRNDLRPARDGETVYLPMKDGGFAGEGISPASRMISRRAASSTTGTAESSARV